MAVFIDTASREPIYLQIVQQVREQIARGELRPDQRLPSVRQLSQELVVNPNTIARAYTELEREGTLISRAGLGIFVARPKNDLTKAARCRRLRDQLDRLLTEAVHLGFSSVEVERIFKDRLGEFEWNRDH
jgi:GntR family transcriptional regulator